MSCGVWHRRAAGPVPRLARINDRCVSCVCSASCFHSSASSLPDTRLFEIKHVYQLASVNIVCPSTGNSTPLPVLPWDSPTAFAFTIHIGNCGEPSPFPLLPTSMNTCPITSLPGGCWDGAPPTSGFTSSQTRGGTGTGIKDHETKPPQSELWNTCKVVFCRGVSTGIISWAEKPNLTVCSRSELGGKRSVRKASMATLIEWCGMFRLC